MALDDDSVTPGELPAIVEEAVWEEHLPAVVTGVKVRGGDDGKGAANFQARVLDARTRYLKEAFQALVVGGLNVIGTLNSQAELDAIPTEDLNKGDAYFVEGSLCVWNLTEWVNSGSLLGPRGITLLGTWPDNQALPDHTLNEVGDAYIWKNDIWLLIPQPDGWVTIGLKGDAGKDAYQIAVDAGFQGTRPQWLASLVGKSTYQIWLDQGNEGTEADFLLSLKGAAGSVGSVKVLGTLNSQAELDAIPTEGLAEGTAYFVTGSLRVWNGVDWSDSGSLLGDRGVTLLGTWPDAQALPPVNAVSVGDAYIWKNDLWLLVPGGDGSDPEADPVWSSIGLEGPEGKSAYQVWLDNGHVGTQPQFLQSLVGKSSYQTWLDQGNTGNEQAFLDTLKSTTKGDPGPEGPARSPFEVKGAKADESLLPTPGTATEAWYVGSHLYVWVTDQAQYVDLGSVGGLSAYDLAVEDGFGGTLQQWLVSLKSTVPGPEGPKGQNLTVKGTVANAPQLGNIQNPEEQDGYVTADDGHLHILTEGIWVDVGPFRGQSTYQLWLDNGHSGSENEFLASLKGTNGTNGTNIVIKGSVSTYGSLPASPEEQDVYAVRDTNTLYARINAAWVNLGQFRGEDGNDGAPGANGSSITIIKILTAEDADVPNPVTNGGKAYVDLDKHLQISLGGVWVDCGPVGAPGERGIQGIGLKLRGTVPGPTYLPLPANSEEGDGWFTSNDKMLYVLTDGEWDGPYDITGLPGPQGNDGEKGEAGTSINILGAYPTLAALETAVPTGSLGDGYLVGDNLAIWTTANGGEWIDIGLVRGPQGIQGVPGPIGIGKKGDKGEKGSSWITLPAGVDAPSAGFTGNIGDWAVSDSFKVYYKSALSGWVYWGQLVAGDVNSPQLSAGKVVRLGNEWVMLPVDEAPAMIAGKLYVRQLIEGSETNEGEWVELEFPPQFDEPPADSQPYMRVRLNGQEVGSWGAYNAPTIGSLGGVPLTALGVTVATLVNGTVPAGQLPSYVDDVLEFANQAAFPATGETGKIYISLATNAQFRWTGSVYIGLVASPGTTDAVPEGATNLYYTPARVRSTPLAGVSFGTGGVITAADTVLTAFGKLQAQITAFVPGFADVPTDTNLYLRKGDKTWVVYTAPTPGISGPAGGADNKTYVYKNNAWIEFNRYDLPIKSISATATIDASVDQFVLINNTGATAKTITLSDGPKAPARAMIVVVKINGAAGVITFAPTGATVLVWGGGSPPSLTGSRTQITFTWDGVEWTGAPGAVVP
mgnify:FL=1